MSEERRYGVWAGNPQGHPESERHCVEEVRPRGEYISMQCARLRGHGPGGLYCRQHAKRFETEGKQ